MSHTPAPWKMMNEDLANPKFHQRIGPCLVKNPISIEDARLIAAAPDLLNCLEDLMSHLDIKRGDWDRYESVLAKAKGTS